MKSFDLIWGLMFVGVAALFISPLTQTIILEFSADWPYLAGFAKFAVLATLGDLLGSRLVTGDYVFAAGFGWRVVVWGVIGMMVTLVFPTYMAGAASSQALGLLPKGSKLVTAFLGSTLMNLTFAPVMNTFHRCCDVFLDLRAQHKAVNLTNIIHHIDWSHFIRFNWLIVSIFFWIPVHTVIFLMPTRVQVTAAAFSSIFLGVILSFAAKSSQSVKAR